MKFKGLVATIAAVLIGGSLAMAGAAQAADPPKALSKEQLAKGAKDGPALLSAAGVTCTPDQFVWLGKANDPKTKTELNAYEVSCKEGLGYVINAGAGPKPAAYDCVAMSATPQRCQLPGNQSPEKGIAARAAAVGRQCAVTKAVYNGATPSGDSYYELACSGGPGFELVLNGAKATVNECTMLAGSPRACKLTDAAAALAGLQPAVTASGKTCALKEDRFIGAAQDSSGDVFYEVACQTGPGFVLVVDKNLGYRRAVDCKLAQGLAGGCKLTDITVTASEDAATYTRLSQKAGFPCTVSKYRLIGVDKENHEVVELQCSNRPDGAVAVFHETGTSEIFDCVRAGALGQECKLTSPSLLYGKYTAALAAKGRSTCKVSNARFLGTSGTADYVETACSDGLPGWVIALNKGGDTAERLLTCKEAAASGVACKLPGNGG